MSTRQIAGTYLRVADPEWEDPLDSSFAQRLGGRWNAPGTYATLYLSADLRTARANVRHGFRGLPYGAEDLDPYDAPDLAEVAVPVGLAVDAVTSEGLESVGLPATYPLHSDGSTVSWRECQPVGARAFDAGLDGVACRSAADGGTEELGYFPRDRTPELLARRTFPEWFWPG